MNQRVTTSEDPDIIASAKALRRAARRALDLGLRTGTPVYVIKDGEIEDLTQEVSGPSRKPAVATVRDASVVYPIAVSGKSMVRERKARYRPARKRMAE